MLRKLHYQPNIGVLSGKAHATKETGKLNFTKIKIFCGSKDIIKKIPLQLEKIWMGKLDIHMQKNEISSISITLRKNLIQVDQTPQFET